MSLSKRTRNAVAVAAVAAAVAVTGFGASTALADQNHGEDITIELKGATGHFSVDDTMAYVHDTDDKDINARLYIETANGDKPDAHILDLTSREQTNALPLKVHNGDEVQLRLCLTEKDEEIKCSDWYGTVV